MNHLSVITKNSTEAQTINKGEIQSHILLDLQVLFKIKGK